MTIKARMCLRKQKFGRKDAERLAARKRWRAYACPLCHAWHLTSHEARR